MIDIFPDLNIGFFSGSIKARAFKLCMIMTLLGVLICRSRFDDLGFCFKVTGLSEI